MALVFVTLLKSLPRVCVCVYEKKGTRVEERAEGGPRDRGNLFVTAHDFFFDPRCDPIFIPKRIASLGHDDGKRTKDVLQEPLVIYYHP